MRNIVLIGFMGCGKSAVGRKLANRLGWVHIDTDDEIEIITGKTVFQLFTKDGAVRFRSEEKLYLKKIAGSQDMVISTGGGMVLDAENVEMLKADGILIHLYADSKVIYQRVKGRRNRPLLAKGDLQECIDTLLTERNNAYDMAELRVDTDEKSIDQIVEIIVQYLKAK